MSPDENSNLSCQAVNVGKEKRSVLYVILRFLIPLALLAWGVYAEYTVISFNRNHASVWAQLTSTPVKELRIVRGQRMDTGSFVYWVEYQFTANGETYAGHGMTLWAPTDHQIQVQYQVDNPAINRIDVPSGNEGWIWMWLALLVALVMSPWFLSRPTQVSDNTKLWDALERRGKDEQSDGSE